ncbi:cofactor-independent phosphoglycerate mutase [Candidatus Formimonas warabiya]|uniref:Cofactor-independent phosphoglycerate mutase n=1 Tax=Formimonas warabiya TaxID=1761012 RepID=A0A3G1KN03_FORW1|nr:cofactor-independent phosphoglycerate mutase [Candidatus Formimonas warabiya]ATW23861.1 cofactor-independent phosphoglycerate mutase [Candidatus Formimonas warabiya]
MKYVVILGDGMADYKLAAFGNRTPLQLAYKPNIDGLAKASEMGMVRTVPDGFAPGSDVANLAVLGYEPEIYYTGRSPIEAVSMGVNLDAHDVAFRCNLVTLSGEDDYQEKMMLDYSSGEISTEEARELMHDINQELGSEQFRFYPGISYRHLLVWANGRFEFDLTPPHDISDQRIGPYLPKGAGCEVLTAFMRKSLAIFADHPVNKKRRQRGLNPATSLWIWGQGKKTVLSSFAQRYGLEGSVVCGVDLIKGLGICAGLSAPDVPGATGNIDTNFAGKAETALRELKDGKDFVYVHVEAPDEAGHHGNIEEKIKAIEEIDDKVVGRILPGLDALKEDYRVMILPDHPTPVSIRTHTAEIVPYMIYDSRYPIKGSIDTYCEENALSSGSFIKNGPDLMTRFIKG